MGSLVHRALGTRRCAHWARWLCGGGIGPDTNPVQHRSAQEVLHRLIPTAMGSSLMHGVRFGVHVGSGSVSGGSPPTRVPMPRRRAPTGTWRWNTLQSPGASLLLPFCCRFPVRQRRQSTPTQPPKQRRRASQQSSSRRGAPILQSDPPVPAIDMGPSAFPASAACPQGQSEPTIPSTDEAAPGPMGVLRLGSGRGPAEREGARVDLTDLLHDPQHIRSSASVHKCGQGQRVRQSIRCHSIHGTRRGGARGTDFEMTRMILTSCQTHSVQHCSIAAQSQIVLPCRSRSANQTTSECCLEVMALIRLSNASWAVWVSPPPSHGAGQSPATQQKEGVGASCQSVTHQEGHMGSWSDKVIGSDSDDDSDCDSGH